MKYSDLIKSVDTVKALSIPGFEAEQNGSYVKYPCHKCSKQAVIKTFGEKKNGRSGTPIESVRENGSGRFGISWEY